MNLLRIFILYSILNLSCSAALAWNPGPFSVERNAKEFPVCVQGEVVEDRVVWAEAPWQRSKATVKINRVLKGSPKEGDRITFEYWSQVDNAFHLPHSFTEHKNVILFLEFNNYPAHDNSYDPGTYQLQFAKAQNKGYAYYLQNNEGIAVAIDALFPEIVIPLSDFLDRLTNTLTTPYIPTYQ